MWKIAVGFAIFAALAIFMLMKGGDIDMSGEQHGVQTHEAAPEKSGSPAAAKN